MKRLLHAMLASLTLTGCQTYPGFRMGWEFTLPPAMNNTNVLHPIPTAPVATYAVESAPNMPVVTRHITPVPAPTAPPIATTPGQPAAKPQALPMPTPGSGAVQSGCGASYE